MSPTDTPTARPRSPESRVRSAEPTDAAALRTLAQLVTRQPALVAIFVGDGNPAPVVIARSAGVELDAGAVLKDALASFGGRGGGKPDLAQGGVTASSGEIVAFLRQRLIS